MTVVAQNDRPKSVRNRFVIKRFCCVSFVNITCTISRLGVIIIRLCQMPYIIYVYDTVAQSRIEKVSKDLIYKVRKATASLGKRSLIFTLA